MQLFLAFIAAVALLLFLIRLLKPKAQHISSLAGKHVVITGGSSGIGFALAKRCAAEGAFLTLMARSHSKLLDARQALSSIVSPAATDHRIQLKAVDVGDAAAITSAILESYHWRPIDILICNAGFVVPGCLGQMNTDILDNVTRTNFLGYVYPVNAALPLMKTRSLKTPVSIVFMSSLSGLLFVCGTNLYGPTKHALKGLAEMLRMELMPYNIGVHLVCPGFTETPMLDEADKLDPFTSGIAKLVSLYDRSKAESAVDVAAKTIEGVKRGHFLITTSYFGFLIGVMTRGVFPAESFSEALLETILILPLKLVSFLFLPYLRWLLNKLLKDSTEMDHHK